MSDSFQSVLRPGWRFWLSTFVFALGILIDIVIVIVVCAFVSGSDRGWFDWLLAAVLVVVLLFWAVRGFLYLLVSVEYFLRPPYPVMLSVDRQRVRIMSGWDRRTARYTEASWDDLVAAVFSQAGVGGPNRRFGYVQFVAAKPASLPVPAIKGPVAWRVRNLGLDPAAAALAWVAVPGSTPGLLEALAAIRRLAPGHVRIVDSLTREPDPGIDLKGT